MISVVHLTSLGDRLSWIRIDVSDLSLHPQQAVCCPLPDGEILAVFGYGLVSTERYVGYGVNTDFIDEIILTNSCLIH